MRCGVTPNTLTLTGTAIMLAAGVCYAIGAGRPFGTRFDLCQPQGPYLLLAACLLVLSSACDMLDGAVARLGNLKSRFGAFLDSTLDRYSDFAVYAGIAVYYASSRPGNVTLCLLAMVAFMNSFMISYTRARAEDLIEHCTVGYWQRGERSAAILIATFAHNVPALLVQQAISPAFTVLRRMLHTHAVINGRATIDDPRQGGWWLKVRLWRWPRHTWAYDVVTGLNIAFLIWARIPSIDPVGQWLGRS